MSPPEADSVASVVQLGCTCVVLQVAPVTAQHIFKLVTMGAYTGNHIFRSAHDELLHLLVARRTAALSPSQIVSAVRQVGAGLAPTCLTAAGSTAYG
jgi:hypothetical protein